MEVFYESFNSRTRKGCDAMHEYNADLGAVSIHAPVKGATALNIDSAASGKFQFTHP